MQPQEAIELCRRVEHDAIPAAVVALRELVEKTGDAAIESALTGTGQRDEDTMAIISQAMGATETVATVAAEIETIKPLLAAERDVTEALRQKKIRLLRERLATKSSPSFGPNILALRAAVIDRTRSASNWSADLCEASQESTFVVTISMLREWMLTDRIPAALLDALPTMNFPKSDHRRLTIAEYNDVIAFCETEPRGCIADFVRAMRKKWGRVVTHDSIGSAVQRFDRARAVLAKMSPEHIDALHTALSRTKGKLGQKAMRSILGGIKCDCPGLVARVARYRFGLID